MTRTKPVIIAGVDITRKYTIEEVTEMYHSGRYRNIVLQGWIVRADDDGLVGFVPWHESTLARMEAGTQVSAELDVESMRQEVEAEHPIIRRDPHVQRAAVALRILNAVRQTGSTGLTDEQKSEILGEWWKTGDPTTGEEIEALAAHFLNKAQHTNREADSHRTTRQHMTA